MIKRQAKALISLRVCAGWSEPLLVAHITLLEISCHCSFVPAANFVPAAILVLAANFVLAGIFVPAANFVLAGIFVPLANFVPAAKFCASRNFLVSTNFFASRNFCASRNICVLFVLLLYVPKSTTLAMARRSVHLITSFLGKIEEAVNQYLVMEARVLDPRPSGRRFEPHR